MPFYSFHCDRCDSMQDAYRHVSERHNGPDCTECGKPAMTMVIVAPQVANDLPGYESPVTGKWIEGRVARTEDLRRSGCRPYEEGERADFERQKKHEEQKTARIVEENVRRAYYALPESKRRALTRG